MIPSRLDPFADKLAGWLKTESNKSRKQRRTIKQMHADLVALGYEGSYNRVAARTWLAKRQEAEKTTGRGIFVPLAFGPGEAFQFDWSEDWAVLGGERTKPLEVKEQYEKQLRELRAPSLPHHRGNHPAPGQSYR